MELENQIKDLKERVSAVKKPRQLASEISLFVAQSETLNLYESYLIYEECLKVGHYAINSLGWDDKPSLFILSNFMHHKLMCQYFREGFQHIEDMALSIHSGIAHKAQKNYLLEMYGEIMNGEISFDTLQKLREIRIKNSTSDYYFPSHFGLFTEGVDSVEGEFGVEGLILDRVIPDKSYNEEVLDLKIWLSNIDI